MSNSNEFQVTFHGTNGSCACNNGKREKYGTNTICVSVSAGSETLIFDAGTGLCSFAGNNNHTKLFLSHYHVDHISGLLFFSDFFNPQKKIDVYGSGNVKEIIDCFLSKPFHPVGISEFKSQVKFHSIKPNEALNLRDVKILTYSLSHPGGSLGYRVEFGGKVFCYCMDIELAEHQDDEGLMEFTRNADLLVLDSFFDDGKCIAGWGHSSWRECAEWALRANAKRLALFHYDYKKSDSEIDIMEKKAQEIFPCSFAASDKKVVLL
jgi:phosphoribosyl 1,2-cyclic phosphodiesterase